MAYLSLVWRAKEEVPGTMVQKRNQISRIPIEDAKRRRKELVFIDARSATSQARDPSQVPGAIHVPLKELDKHIKLLPHNRTLITYCS
ncbi:MAG: rhodanese-like domain-containing protein [Candidatus Binataceae bacterium]